MQQADSSLPLLSPARYTNGCQLQRMGSVSYTDLMQDQNYTNSALEIAFLGGVCVCVCMCMYEFR